MTIEQLKRGTDINAEIEKMRAALLGLEKDAHIKIGMMFIGELGERELLINFYKKRIEELKKEFEEL